MHNAGKDSIHRIKYWGVTAIALPVMCQQISSSCCCCETKQHNCVLALFVRVRKWRKAECRDTRRSQVSSSHQRCLCFLFHSDRLAAALRAVTACHRSECCFCCSITRSHFADVFAKTAWQIRSIEDVWLCKQTLYFTLRHERGVFRYRCMEIIP